MMNSNIKSLASGVIAWLKRLDRGRIIRTCWNKSVQIARRSIGVPDYATYLAHLRDHHPDRVPMSYQAFFVDRQNARYKGGGGRCC